MSSIIGLNQDGAFMVNINVKGSGDNFVYD